MKTAKKDLIVGPFEDDEATIRWMNENPNRKVKEVVHMVSGQKFLRCWNHGEPEPLDTNPDP